MSTRADRVPHAADAVDSSLNDAQWLEGSGEFRSGMSRWMGWRLRLLVGAALLGCLGLFLLARSLAEPLGVDAVWRAQDGRIVLLDTNLPALRAFEGRALNAVAAAGQRVELPDDLALQRSGRWLIGDAVRARHGELQRRLGELLSGPSVTLEFAGAARSAESSVTVPTQRRGFARLPMLFWIFAGIALALYLVAMAVLLARPSAKNALYAVMALCQGANVAFIGVEFTTELGLPPPWAQLAPSWRMALDLATAAAVVHAFALHPRRLPGAPWIAAAAWLAAAAIALGVERGALVQGWWWAQMSVIATGTGAVLLMSWSYRLEPHPFAMVMRRFGLVAIGSFALLTVTLAIVQALPGTQQNVATVAAVGWYVFFALLLMLVPFMSKSSQIMREFALLAAISTVATSLDLLFVAVFSLGQFQSLTLSLFVFLAVYAGARQWIMNQLLGESMVTTERMFEQLYRIAREVEVHPDRVPMLLSQLLRELFEPLEVALIDRPRTSTRSTGDGSTLLVPVPVLAGSDSAPTQAIALRFARRGRRLFTSEDARLTDRIVEQLKRAVAFDKAVEQGRSEERARLAQDLHDDIGARLLTLMYKAPSPEMEDYVRHTLQDLKTLTRGLAAANHRLSHAAAEWKADLTQRLSAAHIELGWSLVFDQDVLLSVVQWSALTRVLRELASNAIAHAQAQRLDIVFTLEDDTVELIVTDNGVGRNPRAWAHGLGLGGVRKRIKQLGGEVEWREAVPTGISCRVVIRDLSTRP